MGAMSAREAPAGTFAYYGLKDRSPRYEVVDTEFGTMYGAYRPAEEDSYYWRIANFMMPFYVQIPTGLLGHQIWTRAWVPLDDEHMMFISMSAAGRGPENGSSAQRGGYGAGSPYLPSTSDGLGRWRVEANRSNDYLIDRDKQRRKESYTGITGIHMQDQAITESMGPINDRSREHLGTSDAMVIRTRRRLLNAARALRDEGMIPPGVDEPQVYRQRSGGVILPRDVNWVEATRDLRTAFVDHPELDLSVVGSGA
jgi:phthalate 4,5-dioxygenase